MRTVIENNDGSLTLERVAFDSEIFALEIGRVTDCKASGIDAFSSLHAAGVERARSEKMVHLTRRVPGDAFDEIRALESTGYHLVDLGIVFDHDLADVKEGLPPGVKVADEAAIVRVIDECGAIFRTSRYYHDPALPPAGGDEVHRRWIRNEFNGRADVVLVLEDAVAFVTCVVKDGIGNIALFGVARSAQGRGAGLRLLEGSLGWFKSRGCSRVNVKTQAINRAASRMYERGGFRLSHSELTYAIAVSQ